MRCQRVVLTLVFAGFSGAASAQPAPCDPKSLRDVAETARFNIIAAVDGAEALDAWRTVFDSGGAVGWAVTEYNVDARSTFVFAFERSALRVYRAGAFGVTADAAMDGCIDQSIAPEAVIPWHNVREIEAGNWVLWFKLREPVVITSDRGRRKKVNELKAYFHGGPGGDLTYYYNLEYEGHIPFWNIEVYKVNNLRGIAVGPNDYQRRLQFVIASVVDTGRRIALTRKGRGAGW
ncbi:MAG: hypothetical protein JJE40_11780 [Vicinamibacteria bacterium]|nr:hypothetical protein [Vicinamibacteria bacterium]